MQSAVPSKVTIGASLDVVASGERGGSRGWYEPDPMRTDLLAEAKEFLGGSHEEGSASEPGVLGQLMLVVRNKRCGATKFEDRILAFLFPGRVSVRTLFTMSCPRKRPHVFPREAVVKRFVGNGEV